MTQALRLEPIDASVKAKVTLRMAREFLSGGLGADCLLLVAVTPGQEGAPFTTRQVNTLPDHVAAELLRAVAAGLVAKGDAARAIEQARGQRAPGDHP